MKTIKTHLPAFHLAPELMLSWAIDNDYIHLSMEEPFGICGLDLILVVGLLNDGSISTDIDDILDAKATSCDSDSEFEVEPESAIRILKSVILPYIEENFPCP